MAEKKKELRGSMKARVGKKGEKAIADAEAKAKSKGAKADVNK